MLISVAMLLIVIIAIVTPLGELGRETVSKTANNVFSTVGLELIKAEVRDVKVRESCEKNVCDFAISWKATNANPEDRIKVGVYNVGERTRPIATIQRRAEEESYQWRGVLIRRDEIDFIITPVGNDVRLIGSNGGEVSIIRRTITKR